MFGYNPPKMIDVHTAESKKLFSVVSMFAGCGGSSTGYRLAGGNVIAANEFMEAARNIYSKNYPNTFIFPEDIRTLTGQNILDKLNLKKGDLDILDGSPPCVAFSQSGIKEKSWKVERKYSSTKQRVDDLFYEYARILNEIQPKVFVAENVKGLTLSKSKSILGAKTKSLKNFFDMETENLDNGMDETIVETLRQCGYKVAYKVLNAADFGVPQKRERLIFIGVRNDLGALPSFPRPTTLTNPYPGKAATYDLLFNGSEVELDPESKNAWYLKTHFHPHISRTEIKKIKSQNNLKFFEQRFARSNWHKYYMTILQSDFGNIFHPIVDRYCSVEEARRVQSFPDDFDFLTGFPERKKVSINDILNNEYKYVNYHAGKNSGDIKKICEYAGFDFESIKDEKIFSIDLHDRTLDNRKKLQANAWEFIGRAVPPLLMQKIAEHVYESILKKVKI